MDKRVLLFMIKAIMPIFYLITVLLFGIPFIGRLFMFVIPIANYARLSGLSFKQRYRCVIFDTFDMLFPQLDYPQTRQEVESLLFPWELRKLSGLMQMDLI
jgi:hypothetical protein